MSTLLVATLMIYFLLYYYMHYFIKCNMAELTIILMSIQCTLSLVLMTLMPKCTHLYNYLPTRKPSSHIAVIYVT